MEERICQMRLLVPPAELFCSLAVGWTELVAGYPDWVEKTLRVDPD